jgi:hypothetical protein
MSKLPFHFGKTCSGSGASSGGELHPGNSVAILCGNWYHWAKQLIKNSYFRGTMLVLAVLLTGAANLMCFSCDADHDANTPPLVVEFSFIAGAHGGVHAQRSTAAPVAVIPVRPPFTAVSCEHVADITMAQHLPLHGVTLLPLLC